ncbi:protein V57 [Bovine alphaherpesvirus 5]|nr:protein V57 [Bovine alphaherpesvirus 5]
MALARAGEVSGKVSSEVFGEARVATVADYTRFLASNRAAAAKLRAAAAASSAAGEGGPGGDPSPSGHPVPRRVRRAPSLRAARRPNGPAADDDRPSPEEARAARLYAAASPARARRSVPLSLPSAERRAPPPPPSRRPSQSTARFNKA